MEYPNSDKRINRIIFPFMGRWKASNYGRFQQILSRCAKKGVIIHVFQPPSSESIKELSFQETDFPISDNINLHTVKIPRWLWNLHLPPDKILKKGLYSVLVAKEIQKFVQNGDVILWYNFPHFPLIKIKCRKILDYADDMIEMLKQELGIFYNPFIIIIARVMLKKMLKNSYATTVISSVLLKKIKGINSRTFLLPNGADIKEFERNNPSKCPLNFSNRHKTIGYIGAIEYFVDIMLIANTASRLPNFDFLIIGAGRELKKLKKYKNQMSLHNLHLLSPIPHSEIKHCLAFVDICWLPFKKCSVSDGATPIKIFEYAAMKKHIISTKVREMLNIGEKFVNFADGVEETVSLSKDIAQHPEKYLDKVEAGYKLVKEEYSWDKITDAFLSIIKYKEEKSG